MVLKRNYFAVAALITAFIFILGILVGVQLDVIKMNTIQRQYKQAELELYDIQLKSNYYGLYRNVENYCDIMIKSNMEFSDKIYSRGLEIERYEKQSKIISNIRQEKQEYALMKFQFWLNAIKLREFCNATYATIIYFYRDKPSATEEIFQNAESHILLELKQQLGPSIILVPLAVDLNIESIDLLVNQFNIKEVPSIVINEQIVLSGVVSKERILQELNRASIKTVA